MCNRSQRRYKLFAVRDQSSAILLDLSLVESIQRMSCLDGTTNSFSFVRLRTGTTYQLTISFDELVCLVLTLDTIPSSE